MRGEAELNRVDTIVAGVNGLTGRQCDRGGVVGPRLQWGDGNGEFGVDNRQTRQFGGHRFRQSLGGLGARRGEFSCGSDDLGLQLLDLTFQVRECLFGHVELRKAFTGFMGPLQDAVDVGAVQDRHAQQEQELEGDELGGDRGPLAEEDAGR